jgi:hypothetical protein
VVTSSSFGLAMSDTDSSFVFGPTVIGIIAGIGGFVVLVTVIAIVFCIMYRKRVDREMRKAVVSRRETMTSTSTPTAADQYSSGDVVNFSTAPTMSTGSSERSSFVSAREQYDSGNLVI